MITHQSLPTDPLPHLAMDYARLRAEGLRLLGRLAGEQWTDFNAHDPGITILEQLCYAITDLAYRTNFPMADLLAGSSTQGLPGPAEILPCDPVTQTDLRKLALDIGATDNVWVGAQRRALDFYFHEGSGQLRLRADASDIAAPPVELRGPLRIAVQMHDDFWGNEALDQLSLRLHGARLLGQDFEFDRLESINVTVRARIEVAAIDEPNAVLADIIQSIDDCLAPSARFVALAEARASGMHLDQLFEGPYLARGFVAELPEARRSLYASDLIHAITNVAPIRAVLTISPQSLTIPEGKIARLSANSELILQRNGLPIRTDLVVARSLCEERRRARRSEAADMRSVDPPVGRNRSLARYRSISRQMPEAYGVGVLGLPSSVSVSRQAQARQLQAYLLIFDQLLANEFAQLAHAHELLSPNLGTRTYFTQPVIDPPLQLQDLIVEATDGDAFEVPSDGPERSKRFLAHLLARFAEQLGDYSQVRYPDASAVQADSQLIADRQAFLADYPRLSRARGSGYDLRTGAPSGLAERLRWKLGMRDLHFELVEHILLRPVVEDTNQLDSDGEAPVPLLVGVNGPDPWSCRISFAFEKPNLTGERTDAWFEELQQFVGQTVLAETPAHLSVQLHWFDANGDVSWTAFSAAMEEFRRHLRTYRWPGPEDDRRLLQLQLRDARDRVAELLGIGYPYPLRDLPVPAHLVVTAGAATKIPLGFSQRGVIYELRDSEDREVTINGTRVALEGTGGRLELPTPPIELDLTYRILATKRGPTDPSALSPPLEPRQAWLRGSVTIEEGIDPALRVEMLDLSQLDVSIESPKAGDARIADYGAQVRVAVYASQEGVGYQLVNDGSVERVLSGTVVGTSSTIVLTLEGATEDINLRVRGSRLVGDPHNPELRTALLDQVLLLRVRANREIDAEVSPRVVSYGSRAVVRLSDTQKSSSYRLWARAIRDREFVFAATSSAPTIDVATDADRVVRILRPNSSDVWQDLPGFSPVGTAQQGSGGLLEFELGACDKDTIVLIQATKQHNRGRSPLANDEPLTSSVQLHKVLALLVRPDHSRQLRLQVAIADASSVGPWLLSDGQPGVYYELRLKGAAIALPGYFHQRDDLDIQLNKGIGRLGIPEGIGIEIDLAIARDRPGANLLPAATTPPLTPLLESGPVPCGAELKVIARRAMTGLVAPLERTAILEAPPHIFADPTDVEAGGATKIVIETSVVGERYTLLRADQVVGEPREGDGKRLEWDNQTVGENVVFAVSIQRDSSEHLPLERRIAIPVSVIIPAPPPPAPAKPAPPPAPDPATVAESALQPASVPAPETTRALAPPGPTPVSMPAPEPPVDSGTTPDGETASLHASSQPEGDAGGVQAADLGPASPPTTSVPAVAPPVEPTAAAARASARSFVRKSTIASDPNKRPDPSTQRKRRR